jgi:hypothetical protein
MLGPGSAGKIQRGSEKKGKVRYSFQPFLCVLLAEEILQHILGSAEESLRRAGNEELVDADGHDGGETTVASRLQAGANAVVVGTVSCHVRRRRSAVHRRLIKSGT